MNNPLVSVIIPNYNHEKYLDERIQSVLNQTYQNFEIIILDDKSTDNSVDVINRYSDDNHVKQILINKDNSGSPFLQWQKGFLCAKGDVIWIAESDDFCRADFLEEMVPYFDDEDCSLAFCKSLLVDSCGVDLGFLEIQDDNSSFEMEGSLFIRRYLRHFNFVVNASAALFRKSALNRICNEYTKYHGCGDWLFWAEIAKCGRVVYVNQALNSYRQHNQSTTSLSVKSGRGEIETYKAIRYLYDKDMITSFDYFRTRLGKLSDFMYRTELSDDVLLEIFNLWKFNFVDKSIVTLHHLIKSVF